MRPLHPDEAALGVSYDAVDDFLEGKDVKQAAENIIIETFNRTAHKRALPAAPDSHRDV
jgi:NAD+ synthase